MNATPEPSSPANPLAPVGAPAPPTAESAPPAADAGGASEETLWVGRTDWRHYMLQVGTWALLCVVYLYVFVKWISRPEWTAGTKMMWAGLPVVISGLVVFGRIGFRILWERYRLTQQRLFLERGILSQTIDQTELIRVDDVRIRKTVIDRVFGLGTIELMSTDMTDKAVTIEGVANADSVAETIRSNMRQLRNKRAVYMENL